MLIQAFLTGTVVIRHHKHDTINARAFSSLGQGDCFQCCMSGACNNLYFSTERIGDRGKQLYFFISSGLSFLHGAAKTIRPNHFQLDFAKRTACS